MTLFHICLCHFIAPTDDVPRTHSSPPLRHSQLSLSCRTTSESNCGRGGTFKGGVATCCWERHTGTIKVAPRTIRKGACDCWYTALTFRRQPSILLFTVAFFLFHIILLDGLVPSFSLTASSFAGEDILFVVANNGTTSHCHCFFLLNLSSLLDFVACTSKLRTTNGTVTMSDEI